MRDKIIYEIQGEMPPTYCCDGKKAIEGLNNMHKAVDAALQSLAGEQPTDE